MARNWLLEFRRDTAANWTATNPTLAAGEPGFETDTGKMKVGDGALAWNALGYLSPGGGITSVGSSGGSIGVTNPAGPAVNVDLPNSGAAAATYGDASHVAQITVNAKGIVTAAANVAVAGGGSSVGYLGSASTTAAFSTASGAAVQVTGLTATVTVPAGVRVKITVQAGEDLENNTANGFAILTLWDGTVGSGTQIGGVASQSSLGSQTFPACLVALQNPGAGNKTYNVGLASFGGTAKLNASATFPSLLLVEAI